MTRIHQLVQVTVALTAVAALGCRRPAPPAAARDARDAAFAPAAAAPEKARLELYRDPQPIPALTLTDLDGNRMSSSEWRGKVTLVNFWATWCPPCRAEIPDLIRLQEKYPGQLRIVGISEDDAPEDTVRAFVAAQRMNYRVAMTTPDVEKAFPGVSALPTTFVIDPQGRIVQRHVGMLEPDRTELETRALAGLPVDATIVRVDRAKPLKIDNAAQLKSVPGVDLSHLSAEQRATALQKLNSDGCTCGCDLTLARCRVEDPSCGVSLPLARKVVEEIAASHQ